MALTSTFEVPSGFGNSFGHEIRISRLEARETPDGLYWEPEEQKVPPPERRIAFLKDLLGAEGDVPADDPAWVARALLKGYVSPERLRECRAAVENRRREDPTCGIADVMLQEGYLTIEQFLDLDASEPEPPSAAEVIGKYRLIRLLGRGGMGEVYEAEDGDLKRRVALKISRDREDAEIVRRMQREAAIAARLRHPNIVEIYDFGTAKDSMGREVHFIAMEYVSGKTLAATLAERSLARRAKVELLEKVAQAVGYAHSQGVLHRDLKPENVLIDEQGRVVLTDFGLARADDLFHSRLTQSQTLIGTPQYMAPEQVTGKVHQISAQTDVYALGVVLYETLTGRPPFSGGTPGTLYPKILNEEPAALRKFDPTIERDLETICAKAMAKERRKRYRDGNEFAREVARFLKGEPISARPSSWPTRLWKRVKRRRWFVFAVAGALAILPPAAWVWRSGARRERESRERETVLRQAALDAAEAQRLFEAGQEGLSVAEASLYDTNTSPEEALSRISEARGWVEQGLAKAPDSPRGRYLLGRLWDAEGDEWEAERNYREAIRLDPAFGMAHYFLGRSLTHQGAYLRLDTMESDPEGAVRDLNALAEEAIRELGIARDLLKGWEDERALDLAFAMIELVRKDWEALVRRVRAAIEKYGERRGNEGFYCLLAMASPQERMVAFQQALRIHPRHWMSLFFRSGEHSLDSAGREAADDLSLLIRIRPRFAIAYFARGQVRSKMEDWAGAVADFEKVIRLDHGRTASTSHAYVFCASNRSKLGDLAGAVEDLGRHVILHACPGSYAERARLLTQMKDFRGAIRDATTAIDMEPSLARAHGLRGQAHARLGEWDQALADFDTYLRLVTGDPGAYVARGDIYCRRNEADLAIADYERALAISPADWPGRRALENWIGRVRKARSKNLPLPSPPEAP